MQSKIIVPILVASLCLSGCAASTNPTEDTSTAVIEENSKSYTCDEGDSHALEADGEKESYQNVSVEKTGDSEGDDADFYGSNAAVFA